MQGRREFLQAIFLQRRGAIALAAGAVSAALTGLSIWRDEGPVNHQPPQLLTDVPGLLPWWAWLLIGALCLSLVIFEGGYQIVRGLEQRATRLDRQIPHNRDALVAAISDLEARAKEVVTNGWVLRESKNLALTPIDVAESNLRDSKQMYFAAKGAFTREQRIAGSAFAICLGTFRDDVQFAALSVRPVEEIAAVHQEITRATEKVLALIESGDAYRPTLSTQKMAESHPRKPSAARP